jgi:hypothetical protein
MIVSETINRRSQPPTPRYFGGPLVSVETICWAGCSMMRESYHRFAFPFAELVSQVTGDHLRHSVESFLEISALGEYRPFEHAALPSFSDSERQRAFHSIRIASECAYVRRGEVNQRQNRRGQYKVTQHASSIACRVRRRNSMCRRSTSERRGGHYRTIWMNPIKWRFCRACPSSLAYRP